ncbi:MAG: hypothetical protein JO080_02670 [Mucilaginibacter sp.]|nr:hypothetical protein [Mucilaginibacter sp.]
MTIDLIQSLFLKEFANIRIINQIFNREFKNIFSLMGGGWRVTVEHDYNDLKDYHDYCLLPTNNCELKKRVSH